MWFFGSDKTMLEGLDVFRLGRALRYHSRFHRLGPMPIFCGGTRPASPVIRTYERGWKQNAGMWNRLHCRHAHRRRP